MSALQESQPLLADASGANNYSTARELTPTELTIELLRIIPLLLPEPLDDATQIRSNNETPVTPAVVKYVRSVATSGGGKGYAVVYASLKTIEVFNRLGAQDDTMQEICEQRAIYAEVLARELIETFPDRPELYIEVLTKRYSINLNGQSSAQNSAMELALHHTLTNLLAQPALVRCTRALWIGTLLMAGEEGGEENDYTNFALYKSLNDPSYRVHANPIRLTVPQYQSQIGLVMSAIFLALYSWVILERRDEPGIAEWAIYFFTLAYIFDDIRQYYRGGVFYLRSLFRWLNLILWPLFIMSFYFRMLAAYSDSDLDRERCNDTAYDLLASAAIFLWMRVLTMLDGFRFFGTMVVVLEWMMREGVLFFFMLAYIFAGFAQSFNALEPNVGRTFELLVLGFLQQPDFDIAESYHPVLGRGLYIWFLFLTMVILLNLLVALFNDAYVRVITEAHAYYLTNLTHKCYRYLKAADRYPFAPPFNLLEVFVLIPLSWVVSGPVCRRINRFFLTICFWPALGIIAYHESRLVRHGVYNRELYGSVEEEVDIGGLEQELIKASFVANATGRNQQLRNEIAALLKTDSTSKNDGEDNNPEVGTIIKNLAQTIQDLNIKLDHMQNKVDAIEKMVGGVNQPQ